MAENNSSWPCRNKNCATQECAAQFSVNSQIVQELGKHGLRWSGPKNNGICGAVSKVLLRFASFTDLPYTEAAYRTSAILTGELPVEGNLPDASAGV